MKFQQNKNDFSVSINLNTDNIEYKLKTKFENIEAYIKYEQVENDKVQAKHEDRYLLVLGWFVIGIFLISGISTDFELPLMFFIGALSIGGGSLYRYYQTKIDYMTLKTENYKILVLNNISGNEFIEKIKEKRNEYLKDKYGKIIWENEPETELNRFAQLKLIGAITEEEFENIKIELLMK